MRAAICENTGGPVAVVDDVEVENPRAGEVLIRVSHCGLCHSTYSFVTARWSRWCSDTRSRVMSRHSVRE